MSRWKVTKRPVYRDGPKTFWNGEKRTCKQVMVIVGAAEPGWWCAGMEGHVRKAVRVGDPGQTPFYLDNEDGSGWLKVTKGMGSPAIGHRSLPVKSEVPYPS